MCQLVITEKSVPRDIGTWLFGGDANVNEVLVIATQPSSTIDECVQMARAKGHNVIFRTPVVE